MLHLLKVSKKRIMLMSCNREKYKLRNVYKVMREKPFMQKKELKICIPPLTGYMEDAYNLAVAITEESNYAWMYSNFIQLVYQNPKKYDDQPIKFFKISSRNGFIWDADCQQLCTDAITKDMLDAVGTDIIDFICMAIDHGNYVRIYLDEYYLPYRLFYNDYHYTHENMFTGYNRDRDELYGLAYVTDEEGYNFKRFSVDMECVRTAYRKSQRVNVQESRITLMKCNPEKFYEFDRSCVKRNVYEYIHSIHTDERYSEINNPNTDYSFGMSIYDNLVEYYRVFKRRFAIIQLHNIYEHKLLMLNRVRYMIDNRYIEKNTELINECVLLADEANKCKTQGLKYHVSQKERDYEKLRNALLNIKEKESNFMQRFYDAICAAEIVEDKELIYSRWGLWRNVIIELDKHLIGDINVTFVLVLINDVSQGYICLTNDTDLNGYVTPFYFQFFARDGRFMIAYDEKENIIQGVTCAGGEEYCVDMKISLSNRTYKIHVTSQDGEGSCSGVFPEEVAQKLEYINCLAVIHENGYRYAIKNVSATDSQRTCSVPVKSKLENNVLQDVSIGRE